jgi:hypothetical protein
MNLYLNNKWKQIGISISGGADSALLSYLICLNTDADIHFTTQIRCWKSRPWQEYIADQVIDWFKNNFKNKFYIHKNLIPPELEWGDTGPSIIDEYGKLKSGNQIILRSYNEYIIHKYNLDAAYGGINKNPSINIDGALKDRDQGHIPPYFNYNNTAICHPFVHTKKDWIIKQYYRHNILDLLKLTRSCEGDRHVYPEIFKNLDYTNYVAGQHVPECRKCFWCKEREWAIYEATK